MTQQRLKWRNNPASDMTMLQVLRQCCKWYDIAANDAEMRLKAKILPKWNSTKISNQDPRKWFYKRKRKGFHLKEPVVVDNCIVQENKKLTSKFTRRLKTSYDYKSNFWSIKFEIFFMKLWTSASSGVVVKKTTQKPKNLHPGCFQKSPPKKNKKTHKKNIHYFSFEKSTNT